MGTTSRIRILKIEVREVVVMSISNARNKNSVDGGHENGSHKYLHVRIIIMMMMVTVIKLETGCM